MEYEKKYKWAAIALVIMVVLNAVILFSIWLNPPEQQDWPQYRDEERGRNAVHHFMEKELDLTPSQADSLAVLRRHHFGEMRILRRNLEQNRKTYFDMVVRNIDSSPANKDSLVELMAKQYIEIESKLHQHISEMKSVLNDAQQEKFEELMLETFMQGRPGEPPRTRQRQHR